MKTRRSTPKPPTWSLASRRSTPKPPTWALASRQSTPKPPTWALASFRRAPKPPTWSPASFRSTPKPCQRSRTALGGLQNRAGDRWLNFRVVRELPSDRRHAAGALHELPGDRWDAAGALRQGRKVLDSSKKHNKELIKTDRLNNFYMNN